MAGEPLPGKAVWTTQRVLHSRPSCGSLLGMLATATSRPRGGQRLWARGSSTSLHGRRVLGSPSQLLVVVGSSLWQEVINEEVHTHVK